MVSMLPEQPSSYVFFDQMQLVAGHGYWREFMCRPQACDNQKPDADGLYTIELPMIYNRFSVPSQDGHDLQYESDFDHGILVRAPRLDSPIVVRFQVPPLAVVMTVFGILGATGLGLLLHRNRRTEPTGQACAGSRNDGIPVTA